MKGLLVALLAGVVLVGFANISCGQKEGVGPGAQAPDFTLEDLTGGKVGLRDVVGANKATLLVFWATWCPYCIAEVPELIRLNNDYKDKGLKILAVDIGEGKKMVEAAVRQMGINYAVLLDEDNRVASQYGVMGIPSNILLDKDGVVKYRGTTPPPMELLPQK